MLTKINIKEDTFIAKIAARNLKQSKMAITIGNTIYLYNVSKQDFLSDNHWLCHELKHVQQFQEYGYFNFIFKYLWESLQKGYYNNRFEIEARNAKTDFELLNKFHIN
ncbi:DUF4157 domain-containing protein [Taibaiella lutea]|uniref:DUF4157 domain-containing protein n=1 Tax=Taibaiella lutea TaxID=2608001 RepID=A0A5M6CUA0_9BACT|nr:DUF4157 domain-containing protein [Taibaiella lutea]KAA5536575.1 DUF4157 domain-containing protein [Taibaiella lutea]